MTSRKISREADYLSFRAAAPMRSPIEQLHDAALVAALASALVAGAAGYLWGSSTRQDIVFEAGYRACQVEQITGAAQ